MATGKRRRKGPAVAAKPKKCFFCGAEGPLTQEHVLPDWLRHLGFKGTGVRELVQDSDAPIIQQGGAFSKKLKIVCADCNNVWMSAMEDDAKPVLISMFQAAATGKQTMLDASAQLALARWAFKTAAVMTQLAAQTARTFPTAQASSFRSSDRIPENIQVWLGAAVVTPTMQGDHVAQFRYQPYKTDVKAGEASHSGSGYQIFVRLFNVVFYVLGFESTWSLTGELSDDLKKALLPVWQSEHPKLWWPPASTLDDLGGIAALVQALTPTGIPTLAQGDGHLSEDGLALMTFDDEVRQLTTETCALVEDRLRVLTSQPGLINRHMSAGFLARCLALQRGTVALADAGLDDVCAVLSRALLESCLLGLYVLLGGPEAITELMGDYQRNVRILAERNNSAEIQSLIEGWDLAGRRVSIEAIARKLDALLDAAGDSKADATGLYNISYRGHSTFGVHGAGAVIPYLTMEDDDAWGVILRPEPGGMTSWVHVVLGALYMTYFARHALESWGYDTADFARLLERIAITADLQAPTSPARRSETS